MPNYAAVLPNDPTYLRVALSMRGLSEIVGPKDEPQILAMYAACGHPEVKHDEVAWCAAFTGWCLDEGGLPNTRSLLAISYAKYGTALDRGRLIPRGAIAVWHRAGGNHVNFVLYDDGITVTCIGGNQSNGKGGGVTISARLKTDAICFRMPPKNAKPQRLFDGETEEAEPPTEPAPADEAKLPFWKRWWKRATGAGLGLGGIGLGGLTLDASTIYAFCALLGVGFLVFLAYVYLIPPRGQLRKG